MKVSLISAHMNALRGTELHVKDVCHSLVKDGHSVDLITGAKGIASDPLEVAGIKVIECPEILPEIKKSHAYLAGIFKLAGILRESKPDIVHAHGMGVEMVSRISSRLLGFPNVYTVHGWFFGHKGVPLGVIF